jgi:hypothetical protein
LLSSLGDCVVVVTAHFQSGQSSPTPTHGYPPPLPSLHHSLRCTRLIGLGVFVLQAPTSLPVPRTCLWTSGRHGPPKGTYVAYPHRHHESSPTFRGVLFLRTKPCPVSCHRPTAAFSLSRSLAPALSGPSLMPCTSYHPGPPAALPVMCKVRASPERNHPTILPTLRVQEPLLDRLSNLWRQVRVTRHAHEFA